MASETPIWDRLARLTDVQQTRCAIPKGEPTVIQRTEKKKSKAQAEADFRAAVWTRDQARSRATGHPLSKSGTDGNRVGEVHHVLKRSTHPEERLNPSNGILISRTEHRLAEATCPGNAACCYLEIIGPADLGERQWFIWRDGSGAIVKKRQG